MTGMGSRQKTDEFHKPSHRPSLVVPACPRLKTNPATLGQLGKLQPQPIRRRLPTGNPFPTGAQGYSQVCQQSPLPIHGMGLRRGSGHRFTLKQRGQLPPVLHPDIPGTGTGTRPAEQRRAGQALQVQDPVVALGSELAHQTEHRRPMTRLRPIFPVERNETTQVRIPLQERHESTENPPIDLCPRKLEPQKPQHG